MPAYIVFIVLTKAFFFGAAVLAFILWANAGFPYYTITRSGK